MGSAQSWPPGSSPASFISAYASPRQRHNISIPPRFLSTRKSRSPSFTSVSVNIRSSFASEGGLDSSTLSGGDSNDRSGGTRLSQVLRVRQRQLIGKINEGRKKLPMKVFLVLLGFYAANALATILGQTGDWDVLVAGIVVAIIELIGSLMYQKTSIAGPLKGFLIMLNYWKAGFTLGLFVDAFKVGS